MKLEQSSSVPVREIASGVDALYMSARGTLEETLAAVLENGRTTAGAGGGPAPVKLAGEDFTIHPGGMGRYRYRLEHEFGTVAVTDSDRLPTLRIQPRAEFLHAQGPRAVASWFGDLSAELVSAQRVTTARLDLFSDWQGWNIDSESRHRLVTRARQVTTREENQEFTGFEVGRRTTGTIAARVYDKLRDVKHKGTDWWFDVWGQRYVPGEQVFRVEFEFGRAGLRQFGIDTVSESLDSTADLWRYATGEWLTLRLRTEDSTTSRWPLDPAWERIQTATLAGGAVGIERVRDGAREGSLRRLMPPLSGYLAQFGSLLGCSGIEDTVAALPGALSRYEQVSPISFAGKISLRRLNHGRAR